MTKDIALTIGVLALFVVAVAGWLRAANLKNDRDRMQRFFDQASDNLREAREARDAYFENSRRWKSRALALMQEKADAWTAEK